MIYKIMPRATISWSDVWTGAADSFVVLIAWVYYSAQIPGDTPEVPNRQRRLNRSVVE